MAHQVQESRTDGKYAPTFRIISTKSSSRRSGKPTFQKSAPGHPHAWQRVRPSRPPGLRPPHGQPA
jgi:hypothetical protein